MQTSYRQGDDNVELFCIAGAAVLLLGLIVLSLLGVVT